MSRVYLIAPVLLTLGIGVTAAQVAEPPSEAKRFFVDDASVTVHFRTYYLDRDRPVPPDSAAWAAGGWLGYESGWLADIFRIGAVGYTSQRVWAPDDEDGTLLLAPGQKGYSVLGQAYGQLKFFDQVFTGYRQWVNQPEVNPQDNRMTPNTFEGYTLAGKVEGVDYFAGYLTKMKTRNEDRFRDFATVAGAAVDDSEPMWLAGVSGSPAKDTTLRLAYYQVPNIIGSAYTDGTWSTTFSEQSKLRLGGQFMYQSSVGDNHLTGASFNTWAAGIKGDYTYGPATLTLAYTQIDKSANYRSPYGSWAGYTSMIVEDFNRAGEKAFLLGGAYDFSAHDLPGLSVNFAAVFGNDAINPSTRAPIADTDEYDFTLDYRFTAKSWPDWARPFWIRARAVRVEKELGGSTDVTEDYRIIINYEWVFK